MSAVLSPPSPVTPAPGGAPPGSGPPDGVSAATGPPFMSVLDDQVARTAVAEGQNGTGRKAGSGESSTSSRSPQPSPITASAAASSATAAQSPAPTAAATPTPVIDVRATAITDGGAGDVPAESHERTSGSGDVGTSGPGLRSSSATIAQVASQRGLTAYGTAGPMTSAAATATTPSAAATTSPNFEVTAQSAAPTPTGRQSAFAAPAPIAASNVKDAAGTNPSSIAAATSSDDAPVPASMQAAAVAAGPAVQSALTARMQTPSATQALTTPPTSVNERAGSSALRATPAELKTAEQATTTAADPAPQSATATQTAAQTTASAVTRATISAAPTSPTQTSTASTLSAAAASASTPAAEPGHISPTQPSPHEASARGANFADDVNRSGTSAGDSRSNNQNGSSWQAPTATPVITRSPASTNAKSLGETDATTTATVTSTPGTSPDATQTSAAGSASSPSGAELLGSAAGSSPVVSASLSAPTVDTPAASAPRQLVDLQDAVDAVRANVTMAVRQGAAEARISLSPASLGTIRISLSQTSDGLVARVVADHPEPCARCWRAATNCEAHCQASGLNLVRLDISSSGQQGSQPGASHQASSGRRSAGGQTDTEAADDHEVDRGPNATQSGNGLLVDVLA